MTYKISNLKIKVLAKREEEKKLLLKNKKAEKKFFTTISLASQIGFTISLPIVGGALLGKFFDDKLSSSPRMTLSLIFFGLFIGVLNVYKILKEIEKS